MQNYGGDRSQVTPMPIGMQASHPSSLWNLDGDIEHRKSGAEITLRAAFVDHRLRLMQAL